MAGDPLGRSALPQRWRRRRGRLMLALGSGGGSIRLKRAGLKASRPGGSGRKLLPWCPDADPSAAGSSSLTAAGQKAAEEAPETLDSLRLVPTGRPSVGHF